jgi:haloalkane dehalogenase
MFVGLPGYGFEPNYAQVRGNLRVHYVDAGPTDAGVIVLLHGEPSWSFLYRKMIPILTDAGYRVIAPDLVGFGRSDKPDERSAHTYARHVEWMSELLFEHLDLEQITLFAQDWGGLIGLRLVAENPHRFARVAIANTGLPTGDQPLGDAFMAWLDASQAMPEFDSGAIVQRATTSRLTEEEVAAYNAPFPDATFQAGPRVMPLLVPVRPDQAGAEANRRAWARLREFDKPFLTLFSDQDPITRGWDALFIAAVPGARGQDHATIKGAGHFLQEDASEELAVRLIEFIRATDGSHTVHVAAPTGDQEHDRASILAAFEQIHPGGTVQFAAGMYRVGRFIEVAVPGIALVGHPNGTTIRGCDPAVFDDMDVATIECNGFSLTGGHQTVRGLTFEYAWHALALGGLTCDDDGCRPGPPPVESRPGGYVVERNTFHHTPNGIRVFGQWSEPAVIRDNRFMNTYHAVMINGMAAHILDNDISVPEPERVPYTRHPGLALLIGGWAAEGVPACERNVIAGNRIEGHPDAIAIAVFPQGACRHNEIRDNTIEVARVRFAAPSKAIQVRNAADSILVGVSIALLNGVLGDGIIEDNRIEGNRILGASGVAIEIVGASKNRIANNTVTGVVPRDPFPGNTLFPEEPRWSDANGSGIWVSPGSDGNEIVGNTFEAVAGPAVVLEGDRNRVETRSASDAVRDLGSGNRVVAGTAPTAVDEEVRAREQRRSTAPGSAEASISGSEGFLPGADGVRLFYRIRGTGPDTVVVLHGGPSLGLAYLAPDLEPLGHAHTLIHYDQRGVGRSALPSDDIDLGIARHVADLEALRSHFGIQQLVLAGHSWGPMVAAHYAAAHPGRVRRMLFIDPMIPASAPYLARAGAAAQRLMEERLDPSQRAQIDSLARTWSEAEDPLAHCRATFALLRQAYFHDPAAADRSRGDFCAGSAEVLRSRPRVDDAILGALGEWDVRPLLSTVDAPVLVVYGEASAIPAEAMEAWSSALPAGRLMVIPGAGHYLYVDRADVFFPAALEFLAGGWPVGASTEVACASVRRCIRVLP